MGYIGRADRALALAEIPLPSPHAAPQGAREDLVALLLARMDVLGDGETGREYVLEARELAAGLEEGDPLPDDRVLDDFSPRAMARLLLANLATSTHPRGPLE